MKDYKQVMQKLVQHDSASPLFPGLAYDQNSMLFKLEDGHVGMGFQISPFVYVDENIVNQLNVLLSTEFPKNTHVQFMLFGSPDILEDINLATEIRRDYLHPSKGSRGTDLDEETRDLLRTMHYKRNEFLLEGVDIPIEKRGNTRIRKIKGYVFIKVPHEGDDPNPKELEDLNELRQTIEAGLDTTGLSPEPIDAEHYIRLMATMVNWGPDASWRVQDHMWDKEQLLRDQIMDIGNAIELDARGRTMKIGTKYVKCLSVKKYPDEAILPNCIRYIGDPMSGGRGVKENFIICANIFYPDQESTKSSLETKRQACNYQSYGPMLKWVPRLLGQKDSHDILYNAIQNGDRVVKMSMHVIVFSDSEEDSVRGIASLRTFWREMGFVLMEDKFNLLPIFLNCLPFGSDKDAQIILRRHKTFATRQVVHLLPIVGEWAGTGTPMMNFVGRNGQLMNVSLFDTLTNYNGLCAAASGSGKSFIINGAINALNSMGGRVWVIDVGRSYEKMCEAVGGSFIEFTEDSDVCLNPFQIVRNWEEEEDMLVGLVSAMAAPNQALTDQQTSNLKRVMKDAWDEEEHKLTIDSLADRLLKEEDQRIIDIGQQLFPFTTRGAYGRFFNGENNVRFDSNLVVCELEELKGRQHLQLCVLLQLIFQIQQAMYLGDSNTRKTKKLVVIDESWDLLANSADVSSFIIGGYRRFRKYGGAALTITQSVADVYNTPSGAAIAENSASMWLLKQKPETVDQLKMTKRLSLGDGGYEILKSVHTIPGVYSEIFFYTEMGAGVGRFVVDRYTQLLYSTKPDEVAAIMNYRKKGVSIAESINAVIEDEKRERSAA